MSKFRSASASASESSKDGLGRMAATEESRVMMKRAEPMFEIDVASTLHQKWREARGKEGNGSSKFTPRLKQVNGISYDIANLEFRQLPSQQVFVQRGDARLEGLDEARVAPSSVCKHMMRGRCS